MPELYHKNFRKRTTLGGVDKSTLLNNANGGGFLLFEISRWINPKKPAHITNKN